MRLLAERQQLDVVSARAELQRAFVEYPGDHASVVKEQAGGAGLVDHLAFAYPPRMRNDAVLSGR